MRRGDVYSVAVDVIVREEHVADVDSDAHSEFAVIVECSLTSVTQFTASGAWKLVSVPSPISPIWAPLNFGSSVRRRARCSASARSARASSRAMIAV